MEGSTINHFTTHSLDRCFQMIGKLEKVAVEILQNKKL
jgi:hypothetical protein